MLHRALFSSASSHWSTPIDVYSALVSEFALDTDPCPLHGTDGLSRPWTGRRIYCNPPYGRGVADWISKGLEADVAVFLLPARTDTRWFHDLVLPNATEIRFLRGRLKFGGAKNSAPFPSMVIVFRKAP